MKIIDFHTHLGKLMVNSSGNTPEMLLEHMDKNGIYQSVVMAVENPEEVDYYFTSYQVLEACNKYPDRLIPFCSIDPRRRYPGKFECKNMLEEYVNLGFKGFGDILAGVPFDYYDLQKVYSACGELGLPIVFHTDYYILFDEAGQPRLENMLQEYPDTIFIGHSIHFWAEISADCQPEDYAYTVYAKGPVIPGGATDRFLCQYPNLYGDLSANSGYNALTRDPEFGIDFLIRQQDKLVFGTDILKPDQPIPILEFLLNAPIPDEVREKIFYKNAAKLLKMDSSYVK